MSDEDRMMQDKNLKWSSASIINNEKRIIYIDGIKAGFKGACTLLELIEKEKTNIKKHGKTLNHHRTHLDYLAKSIREYVSQWENVQLGDQVNYRRGQ